METKKRNLILGLVLVLLLLVVGSAYAFFTYESGTKSDIVTGQIYMNYEETSTISLTGVFPETKEQALARQDENGVFEFTITGRNTSKYPVYYEIDLLEGGVMTGKTETSTKILPEHVMIYLEKDGVPVIEGKTYADWNNKPIYVETVPAGTTSNIEHKYKLRMWINENVTISDTDPNADYTTTEWNDAYTSLKVRVVGDFEYKEAATDASCFAYNVIRPEPDDYDVAYEYPTGITLDTSDEKVEACMVAQMNVDGTDISTAQDGYKSFCEGTGTIEDPNSGTINLTQFVNSKLEIGMPAGLIMQLIPVVNITTETRYYELNTSEESVNACKEYMLNDAGGEDYSDAQDGYQSYCEGTGTADGYSIFEDIEDGLLEVDTLVENNILTQVETPQGEIEITNYDENCETDVIIPSTIEGLPVTRIADGDGDSDTSAFINKAITSVKFPNTLEYIGIWAFYVNNLTEITIPDSVTTIGNNAFMYNNLLETVTINGNPSLGKKSFEHVQTFQYGGTCEELNQNFNVFSNIPNVIITTDTNSCQYTNVGVVN